MTPQFRFKLRLHTATLAGREQWNNFDDGGEMWVMDDLFNPPPYHPYVEFNSNGQESDLMTVPIIDPAPGAYDLQVPFTIAATGSAQQVKVKVLLLDSDHLELDSSEETYLTAGDKILSVTLNTIETPAYVAVKASMGAPLAGPFTRRVTIQDNSIELATNEVNIQEPLGWKQAILKLERDPKFHSLIEFFEMPLEFYKADLFTIRNLEAIHGIDHRLGLVIEIQHDPDVGYELLFDGLIDIAPINEKSKGNTPYRAKLVLMRNDLWAKFFNNKDTPVDVQSEEDLFGESVTPMVAKTLRLPTQKIRYEGGFSRKQHGWVEHVGHQLVVFDFDVFTKEDIKTNSLSTQAFISDSDFLVIRDELPYVPGLFKAPWDGSYTFDIRIEAGLFDASTKWTNFSDHPEFYIGVAGATAGPTNPKTFNKYAKLSDAVIDNGAGNRYYEMTYSGTLQLKKGQQVALFAFVEEFTGNLNIFGNRLTNWVDAEAMTTDPVVLNGIGQEIDGLPTLAGHVIAVNNQVDKRENGIYVVQLGAWTRLAAADTAAELQNLAIKVTGGDLWEDTYWIQNVPDLVLGTTEIEFVLTTYNDTYEEPYPGLGTPDTHLVITADTTFPDSETEAFHIHDVGKAIIDRTAGVNKFYSAFMGNTDHVADTIGSYSAVGSAFRYMLMKGLHLKGFELSAKKFFSSFMEWYDNLDAILSLSLGYGDVNGEQGIIVEEKEYQYDSSSNSVEFFNVDNMIRRYDLELINKKVIIGYSTGKTDTVAANDDPHTKATYATKFARNGKDIPIISDYIAAPTLIEETRRQAIARSTNGKLDDQTFIIAIDPDAVAANTFTPELDENFSDIANIQNPESKYNFRLWPVFNLFRWMPLLNCSLQKYASSVYRFVSGEGNYNAEAQMDPASEDLLTNATTFSQDGNIPVNTALERGQHIHSDEIYECSIPMSWEQYKLIRDNREKSIGISRNSDPTVPYFIKDLQWVIHKAHAELLVWPKDSQVSSASYSPDSLLLETGEFLLQETSDTITLED